MTIKKERNLDWLFQPRKIPLYWAAIGILCICPAGFFVAFYDSPLSAGGMGVLDYVLIGSVISFPLVCLGSSRGIRFLKDKNKKLAFYVTLLPALPLILIFAVITWSNMSSSHATALNTAACAFDGGDGLHTTLCKAVIKIDHLDSQAGLDASTNSTIEAHNWQFLAQQGKQITVQMTTSSWGCPAIRMRILDSRGIVVERFDHPAPVECTSKTITESTHPFDPPADDTYTLRLDTPETPGSYWFNIIEAEK